MYTITAIHHTWLKKELKPSHLLTLPGQRSEVKEIGKQFSVLNYSEPESKHIKVELDYGAGSWYIFEEHWKLSWQKDPQHINEEGLRLIEEFEGLRLDAYLCPARVWTIGLGTTRYYGKNPVRNGDRITLEEAWNLKRYDLQRFEKGVLSHTKGIELNGNQFSALVSLCYNCGFAPLREGKTIKRALERGDYQAAADGFLLWNKANGRVLAGLVRRRKAERELFLQ